MADEENVSTGADGTAREPDPSDPTGFKAYVKARMQGEDPPAETTGKPAAQAQGEGGNAGTAPDAETAPDSEPEKQDSDTDEEEGDTPEEKKLRSGSRKRRLDRLEKENAELTRRLEAAAAPPPVEKPAAAPDPTRPKPLLKDFKTLEEYNEALTDWKLDQREAARKAEDDKKAQEAAIKTEQDGWKKREAAVAKAHPDYQETIEAVKTPSGPGVLAMRQALLEEEQGAEILYHLAKHPEELERIAACTPARAAVEIGKLAAALETPNPGTNGKPKITGAPPPPSRLTRPSGQHSDSIDDPAVQRDWKRWARAREAQLKGR